MEHEFSLLVAGTVDFSLLEVVVGGEGSVHHVLVLVRVVGVVAVVGGGLGVILFGVLGVHFPMSGALWALAPFSSCITEGAATPEDVGERGSI